MEQHPAPQGEILLYDNGGQKEFVSVVFKDENFWLSQSGMAELFDCSTDNISLHLKNIYAEEELTPDATTEKISAVPQKGSQQVRCALDHYNLDAIIAVGYRVNSKKATRFLTNNRRQVLEGKGRISHDAAVKQVSGIYAQFRKKQDAAYISEFDRAMERYLKGGDQP